MYNQIKRNEFENVLKNMVELRVLNEDEKVENLYVNNKTIFLSDSEMIIKGVDGGLEKWEIKKIFPIDKKDKEIQELKEQIQELRGLIKNEFTKSVESVKDGGQSNANVIRIVEPTTKEFD